MELVVFDLDGTLLDGSSQVSPETSRTLGDLAEAGIAYTVATGRTLHAGRYLIEGHGFRLPHIYKNGVMVWDPETEHFDLRNCLTLEEVDHVLHAMLAQRVTPFIFTAEPGKRHAIYHTPLSNDIESRLAAEFGKRGDIEVFPAAQLPAEADITHVSALGARQAVAAMCEMIDSEPHLVAYSGTAWEGDDWHWIDIHHTEANKGGAVESLRRQLGATRVVCFGDNANDVSMFAAADEAYAPDNATAEVKALATAVIGHHDADGVAKFLRKRFRLDAR